MKKTVISTLMVGSIVTSLSAGGDLGGVIPVVMENINVQVEEAQEVIIEPKKTIIPKVVEEVKEIVPPQEPKKVVVKPEPKKKETASKYYVVLKGLSISGDELGTLDADRGYGAGLDLGYKFGNGLAVELGTTYSKNKLDNSAETEMSYKTGSLDLVYNYELSEKFGLFAKAGYLYEKPSKGDTESGLAYGGGLAYKLSNSKSIVGEYETSQLDSHRGDAISLGLMINF